MKQPMTTGHRLLRHQAGTDKGGPSVILQTAAAASTQSPSSALSYIYVWVFFSILCSFARALNYIYCLRKRCAVLPTGPAHTRPARLVLSTGMMLPAASLIHTTCVSPDMRGCSIFDSC